MATVNSRKRKRMSPERRKFFASPAIAVYLGSAVLANWLTTRYGFVSVGFGEMATAGTFAAGLALVVRDLVQDAVGRVGVLLLIAAGALLSFLVADKSIAVASMCAFAVAEVLDMAVYTPLRYRGRFGGRWWQAAVIGGGALGAVADTVVFLWIAFGQAAIRPALPGQLVGKGEVILAFMALGGLTHQVLRQPVNAEST